MSVLRKNNKRFLRSNKFGKAACSITPQRFTVYISASRRYTMKKHV